ncbi:hypothetical protein CEP52_002072 [Fusarium oligoseptatum]|uniref:Major facilitator superfamily (MFS) profile domain-containing protein n=1 Tax=Fusarium oligoseptatum TaxID=2604345 RepID=A0A428UFU1_9HYPO|nr:hypothetical protein CEP52_002072 [Fusarium oligoseptatum]
MAAPRRSQSPFRDASETTPLLGDGLEVDTEASTLIGTATPTVRSGAGTPGPGTPGDDARPEDVKPNKPLPKLQIFLLCYARMTEPIAFFCIFPFIAQMVQENGHLPTSDVGFYSGLIESLFSATQMLVLISWGRLADRIGRKPILVITLVGTAVGPALFGMAKTLPQMILFRCLAGVFSGSSLVIRTMISEHSTPETQARAFSWFAFAGNLGLFIGPIIGGVLANPATQYPGSFGKNKFFLEYPYALPGFVTGVISATSALTSALFLKETLKKRGTDELSHREITSSKPPLSTWQLLKAPGVSIVLWVYGHAMFLAFAFTAIMPVVLYTPVDMGGVEFDSFKISMYMAVQGASQAMWLVLAFPALQHRFAVVAVIGPGVSMAFTGVQLAVNDVAPDSHVLGTLNAVALTLSSGIRSIVPGAATAIYAVGVRGQILWGHLAWVILIPLAAAFAVACEYLPEGRRPKDDEENDENES